MIRVRREIFYGGSRREGNADPDGATLVGLPVSAGSIVTTPVRTGLPGVSA